MDLIITILPVVTKDLPISPRFTPYIFFIAMQVVWDTRFSLLDWVRVAGLSCTKGVWYIYDWDTG